MSKILIIGDAHLKPSNLNTVKTFLGWILDMVDLHKPDEVIYLGDVYHTHAVIRSEIMTLVTEHVKALTKLVPTYILIGNHDCAHAKTPEIHAWIPFMHGYENLTIIDKPTSIDGISYLPYIDTNSEFEAALDIAMKENYLVFCHQTFRNANFGFIVAKEGTTVPMDYKGLIVAGHIHKQQTLGPVWYPGTPYAQEASDAGEVKGINLLDTATGDITFIQSPLPQWITKKASTADFESKVLEMVKGDKNHLVISGPAPEITALMETQRFRELKKEYGFSVKKDVTVGNVDRTVRSANTIEAAIVQYIDAVYDGEVDREVLKVKCLEVLQ